MVTRLEIEKAFIKRLGLKTNYFDSVDTCLLPGVTKSLFESELQQGVGASSSVLAVNSFVPWKNDLSSLILGGRKGFSRLAFKPKFTNGLRGTPPNLAVTLCGEGRLVAIESKFLESINANSIDSFIQHRTEKKDLPHL